MNKKSLFLLSVLLLLVITTTHSQVKLMQQWATDTVLRVPESVLYNPGDNILYVSVIGGNPAMNKEGKGGVAKLTPEGNIIDSNWVTGLNAPKGLGRWGNLLYVADLDEVAVIDIKLARIIYKIPVAGAVYLNDITVDKQGNVYVSDSRKNTVHIIRKKQASLYLDNVANANGLLAADGLLYVLSAGKLLSVNEQKQIITLASGMEKSTDGLVQISEDDFIVSCWAGVIYHVKKDGTVHLLKDFRPQKINTADIGYYAKGKMLYVPTFWHKNVIAYKIL